MAHLVTKQSLQQMLDNPNPLFVNRVVGRALVALLERQTAGEQSSNETTEHNGVGFTGADARSGTMTAKYFIKHGTLLDWQRELWTKRNAAGASRLSKYHRQLNEIAAAKQK